MWMFKWQQSGWSPSVILDTDMKYVLYMPQIMHSCALGFIRLYLYYICWQIKLNYYITRPMHIFRCMGIFMTTKNVLIFSLQYPPSNEYTNYFFLHNYEFFLNKVQQKFSQNHHYIISNIVKDNQLGVSYRYTNFHISRQHSCRALCKLS